MDAQSLLWLASFPRSGNTFCRILLANYFAAAERPYDINGLNDFIPADTNAALWQTLIDEPPGEDIKRQSWKLRPAFIERYRTLPKSVPVAALKTHTANLGAFGSSGFSFRENDRAIYIVRHPLDILLSYADFNNRSLDSAIDMMTQAGTLIQVDHLGGIEVRGSWNEHVSSWVLTPPCPLLLIRYEELRQSTEEVLMGILKFLGAPVLPDRVRQAVEASRFDKVREQESARSFNEAPGSLQSGHFFRKGTSLQWLRELAPEQAYRLADACADLMRRLGYTHPRDVYYDGRNALQPMALG